VFIPYTCAVHGVVLVQNMHITIIVKKKLVEKEKKTQQQR
jgi:hypothetical protein